MSSTYQLNRGIKSLNLTLSTPTDAITGKVRNDLSGVKVWYSTTPNFNPANSEGTLTFSGLSLDIVISNLSSNTIYYVRYAFVSAIDPTVITISNEIAQTTYDENISFYGELTKPSAIIQTNSDGTGGDYSVAGGNFRVFNYSENVTTNRGVEYNIVADSIVGGLDASIVSNTGVYRVNSLTANYGSVMFSAKYGTITIFSTLVVTKARAGVDGTNAKLLKIIADGNAFVFRDSSATVADSTQVTIAAKLQNLTATVLFTAVAYDANRATIGAVSFTSDTANNAITISNTQFNPTGYNNTVAYVVVTASYSLLSDIITLYRINNGSEQIIVELSNESHTIPANYDGSTEAAGYIGSGTTIKVKEGNKYLPIDNTYPYENGTWTVTNTNGVNITPDTTPGVYSNYIDYDTHSNMTQNSAYIDYTVAGKTSTGSAFSIPRRQSFAKSVGGIPGFSASIVNLTTTELVFIKFKNGTYSSNSVTIYTDLQNITNPVYAWTVNGVAQAGATAQQFVFNRPSTVGVYTIGVTVTSSTDTRVNAKDVMSIAFIEEGSDAYTFLFKDPNIVLSANSLGVVENGITTITNHIIGAKGIALLVPGTFGAAGTDITYSVLSYEGCFANMTTIVGTWAHQFNISGDIFGDASVTNAKVVIQCKTPSGAIFLQTCYIAKVKAGATGAAGADSVIADLISEADVVTALSDGTGYTLPTGNALRLYKGGMLVPEGNVSYGGTATKNGLTLTVSNTTGTKGAITLTGTNWTSNQEIFNVTATTNDLTYSADYTIAKSKAGNDAVFVDLLSEAELVSSLTDGTGYTLPTGNSMRLFKGGNQVTTGVAYKVTSTNTNTATQNGLTLTIDINTGAITLTGTAWTSNQESFTLTATYGGIPYTYKYKIAKSRAGSAGVPGSTATLAFLTTTELVFIKRKDGTYSSDYVTLTTFTQNIPDPIFTWTAPDGTVTVKNSTIIGVTAAQQFVFNRPATLGSYLIRVKVTSASSPSLNEAQDAMSIIFLEEGSDAYNFAFKDPYVFLSANSSGVLEGGVTNNVNHIIGAKGMALLTPGTYGAAGVDITYSVVTSATDPTETNVTTNCTAEMGSIVGTWNQQFTVSGAFFTNPSIRIAKVVIKARVAGSSTYFLYTTYYTKQIAGDTGTNAYITQLLQDNVIVNTNSAGTVYTLPTNNKMSVVSGATEVTSGVTYGVTGGTVAGTSTSLTKNGLTLAISNDTNTKGAITLTGANWTSNTETFPLTATLGTSTFNKALSVTKAKDGATGGSGTNARSVDLTTVSQVFAYNVAGTTPSPTSTVITATGQNTTSTVYYEFLVGTTSVQNTTASTYTYTPTAAFTSMPQVITVKLREGTNTSTVLATDVMSMIGVKPGANGTNAISGYLTRDSSVVATTSTGTGGVFSNSGGTFKVFDGTTDVTGAGNVAYTVVGTPSNVSVTISSSGAYSITAMPDAADTGTATFSAVYSGVSPSVTILKTYTITKSKAGANGTNGSSGVGPWSPVMTGGVVQDSTDSSRFYKASGTADWNAQVYSAQSFTGGAYVSWNLSNISSAIMVGLNSDPATDASYASLDFAWYGYYGNLYIYESGVYKGNFGTYTTNTVLTVQYNGSSVKYYKDGVVLYTAYSVGTNRTFYLDSSFLATGDRTTGINSLVFGTTGATAPKSTTGYVYYSYSQATNPGTPYASTFYFTNGLFSGDLSSGWSVNAPAVTVGSSGSSTYWASRYVVTESETGSETGFPTFSYPTTSQSFTGLVTFSNVIGAINGTSNTTTIDGGRITTGSISVGQISNSTSSTTSLDGLGTNTFGIGQGSTLDGIATVGFFKTTSPGTAALGVEGINNVALGVSSTSTNNAAIIFGNKYYGVHNPSTGSIGGYNWAAYFQFRWNGPASCGIDDGNTRVSAKFAYGNFNGGTQTAARFYNANGTWAEICNDSYALQVNGASTMGALAVSSLSVNGVAITTNGGSGGYGAGSTPSFYMMYVDLDITAGRNVGINGTYYSSGAINFVGTGNGLTNGINYGGVGFWTDGNMYSAGTYIGSSRRLKENILPIDVGLNFILSLEPVKFQLISDKQQKVGFIAEDFPDSRFVHKGPIDPADLSKGTQITGIDYTSMVAPLVKAVQELNAKILELTSEIEILKAK